MSNTNKISKIDLTDQEIIEEVKSRTWLKDEIVNALDATPEDPYQEKSTKTGIDPGKIPPYLLKEYAEAAGFVVLKFDENDWEKNQVITKYYNLFRWPEINHLFKQATSKRSSGGRLKGDISMLDNYAIDWK